MAQRRRAPSTGMTIQQINSQIQEQLVNAGYNPQQATAILDMARRMSRGQDVRVPPQGRFHVPDIERVRNVLAAIRQRPDSSRRILATEFGLLHGPERSRIQAISVPRRAPTRTYTYQITMGSRTYEVDCSRQFPARGMTSLQSSRLGQFYRAIADSDRSVTGIYLVTASGRRQLRGDSLQQFRAGYVQRFQRMQMATLRGQETPELITISSIRRREQTPPG
ncbi:MAG: hypothetical protein ABH983_03945 [Candidatus Micrarchaeota archaeon]